MSPIPIHQRVDGLLVAGDFETITGIALPQGPYDTVAGFMLHELQRVPQLGDTVVVDGHRLTVSTLEGRRISSIRVTHPAQRGAHMRQILSARSVDENPRSVDDAQRVALNHVSAQCSWYRFTTGAADMPIVRITHGLTTFRWYADHGLSRRVLCRC
ncbi:transporter associated domain-containing protein [Rhodococcus baikonurensis]|uniref:transporter associated domain-containing protein n=1 Tax=Rhodococcus erythropolis group TaxID=2840174 RepID=UPI00263B542B|nr:transporter associated domain-containing protein [Rhodococcus erythropolis]